MRCSSRRVGEAAAGGLQGLKAVRGAIVGAGLNSNKSTSELVYLPMRMHVFLLAAVACHIEWQGAEELSLLGKRRKKD